ncbi:hypothetical protein NE237_008977 [Protea cynaroides]|uniref:Glucan endo-1,3-beta-D-glucosidase n=1 Tax=Protea cynaroides TaxID=273540 RepID=A0A9Q0KWX0_9MAGN|nr:hypothetical protein NE237_008977 [Protea cynaroides]
MMSFLRQTRSFLMVNAYPFFAYSANGDVISLDYALFRDNPGVMDASNGLLYYTLFDAQIDAVFAAMSTLKYDDLQMMVTGIGWPFKGDENEAGVSEENAATYNDDASTIRGFAASVCGSMGEPIIGALEGSVQNTGASPLELEKDEMLLSDSLLLGLT